MTGSLTPAKEAQPQTAVLFLVFNRPDTTAQVFDAIRKAKPPRLYVAADGPRPNRMGEVEKVAKVREIATSVDWPCEVRTLFREKNLGCKYAVSGAINWFFELEEQGIILEDDCLPSTRFFSFCEELLDHYKDDNRIGMIAGTRLAEAEFEGDATYSFSRLVQIWGWATWRRAWAGYDAELTDWPNFRSSGELERRGIHPRVVKYLTKGYDSAHKINTWDYQWSFRCVAGDLLTIFPRSNLVRNIGFGGGATHTKRAASRLSDFQLEDAGDAVIHPKSVVPNLAYDLNKVALSNFGRKLRRLFFTR